MSARRTRRPLRFPLRLQTLEGRIAPATFTVTNEANTGSGSLRQAVLNANSATGADLIEFSSFFNTPRTITLASEISITGALTIDGTSAANVTISGNNAVRIFNTQAATASTAISLVDLTLKEGNVPEYGYGGAIYAFDEALSATRCVFTANHAATVGGAIAVVGGGSLTAADCVFTSNVGGYGGAIQSGSLTATDCTFRSNVAISSGGAIAVGGTGAESVLTRCEISSNQAIDAGGLIISGTLLLDACTVSGNQAVGSYGYYGNFYPGSGGGMSAGEYTTTIRNSTISGNSAGYGGGIASIGTLVIQNSTITDNTANYYSYGGGGGIGGGAITLESSIVALNYGQDISASTVNARTSSIFDRSGIGTFNDLGGNRPAGENPRLAPLLINGGPTKTHLLLPNSPCINTGSNPANMTTDQRGPGFPRVLAGTADMGASEGADVNPTATPISIPPTITFSGGTNFTVVARYDDDTGIDLMTIDLNDISVTGPGYTTPQAPTARSIAGSGAVVTVTYTVPAPGGAFGFFDGGLYTVAMVANQVGDTDTPVQHFVAAGSLGTFRVAIPGTIEVDEPSDIDDGNIVEGHVSLREAVRLTNAAAGTADTITFDPTVFGSQTTITLTAGQFAISDPLTIVGPGSSLLTLDAGGTSRLFIINPPGTSNLVSLSGLTLTNGGGPAPGHGAGILAVAALTLSDVVISDCLAVSGVGGGGLSVIGSLTMLDCTVSNNTITEAWFATPGGGIFVIYGPVVIERSSIVNNQAGGDGGGLNVYSEGRTVQISDSIFSGNVANTQFTGAGGGGIFINGLAASGSFIRDCTISGNSASIGGGVFVGAGTIFVQNSMIAGNTATSGRGGGIAASCNVTIERSYVVNNQAGGDGGGLHVYSSETLQISDSTFSGNQSNTQSVGSGGGGIFLNGTAPGAFIRNSTISGNVAGHGSPGGGLSMYAYGTLPIANSTITGNSTTGSGGGVAVAFPYNYGPGEIGGLNSTTIAGNSAGSGADVYFFSTSPISVPGYNNLVGVANAGNFTLVGNGNLTGTLTSPLNAMLAPLDNNGGPTKTHALLPGSPAINAGNNAAGLTTDQRGGGFVRVFGAAADIGAYETQPSPPRIQAVTVNDGAAQRSMVTQLVVTFNTQVAFSGPVASAFTLTSNGGKPVAFTATASIQNGLTVVTLSNFTGAETQFGSLGDGRYTLTALASKISAAGIPLDGDGDGQPGDDFTFGDPQGLFRMYGDANGDRQVDGFDFSFFSSTYGLTSTQAGFLAFFDINNDGVIDGFDFGNFSARVFTQLP